MNLPQTELSSTQIAPVTQIGALLAWALHYAAGGWPVFPCSLAKSPLTAHGFLDATTDPDQIRSWWTQNPHASIGLAPPEGCIVVDVDPRHGGSVEAVEALGDLHDTRIVATGGGGWHIYLRVPTGLQFPANLKGIGIPGVDLKGNGTGYLIAPPSGHESGGVYTVALDHAVENAPDWLVRLGSPHMQGARIAVDWGDETEGLDHDAVINLLAPLYVDGSKHYIARALGGYLKKRGCSTGDAERIVRGLPSDNPDMRVNAALWSFGAANPAGASALKELIGVDAVRALDQIVPDRKFADLGVDQIMADAQTKASPQSLATVAPEAHLTFSAAKFGGELKALVSKCRAKAIKPSLIALSQYSAFDPNDSVALARKLAEEFPKYPPIEMARAVAPALEASGVSVEVFAAQIAAHVDVLPRIDYSQPWALALTRNRDGYAEANLTNTIHVLRSHPTWQGQIAYDLLKQNMVVIDGNGVAEWSEERTTYLRAWLRQNSDFEPSKDNAWDAVLAVAKLNQVHPVQIYLNGLVWDGVPRINTWLATYCKAEDSVYTRAVGSKWLIGAVARAYEPGCKVDTMLILQNPKHGTLKSTTFATLVPDDAWFSDTKFSVEKKQEAAMSLFGKWIYEMGELSALSKADAEDIKGFLTSRYDNVRPPYGRVNRDIARGCIFGGSTNKELLHRRLGKSPFLARDSRGVRHRGASARPRPDLGRGRDAVPLGRSRGAHAQGLPVVVDASRRDTSRGRDRRSHGPRRLARQGRDVASQPERVATKRNDGSAR